MTPERGPAPGDTPAVETETYPTDCCEPSVEQWLTWKPTDDGQKIPRAPHVHSGRPDRDVYHDEDLVLIDYDDVRAPDSGTIHPTVREHLEQADSYADVSPSGTGVHLLCRGGLPDGVKTIADTLPATDAFPDAGIEVYDSARFVTMTGRHLQATPSETRPCQAFLDDLVDAYATVVDGTPDELLAEPETSKADLAALETTDDMQDVFDAITQIGPADIRLDSPVTEERSDGSKSRDPTWTTSESETRLASDLECPDEIRQRARTLAEQAEERGVTTGVHPAGFAAACLYKAGQEQGQWVTQSDVAESGGVTSTTIRTHHETLDELAV